MAQACIRPCHHLMKTKMTVYNARVISTLLYGSEIWTTYARQERRLNTFHLRSIRSILGVSWKDKVSNAEVLSRMQIALPGSCSPHERWPHPKRHPVWSAGIREENHWPPTAAIQRCLHERHEGARHRCSILGGPCS